MTFNTPTQITLNVSTVGAAAGAQSVTVTNPDGQKSTGSGILSVSGSGGPTIASVNPSAVGQGGTRNLTLNGTNFDSGATASVSGTGVAVGSPTFVSSSTLTINVKATATAPIGTRDVTVTSGGRSDTCAGCLRINAAPAPASTSPNTAARGATLFVDVLGSNFRAGAKAKFGSGVTVNSTAFVNSGKVTAKITISSGTTVGVRTVKVVNPNKGTGSCVGCFTVR